MKKILLFCLAAMLVLAFTLPAAAKTTLTASGDYMVGGQYLTNPMANTSAGSAISDARMNMDGHIVFKLQTNPKLWFTLGLGFLDKDWGVAGTGYGRYDDSGYNQGVTHTHVDSVGGATSASTVGDSFNTVEIETASITLLAYKGWIFFGRGKDARTGSLGPMLTSKVDANINVDSGDSLYDRIMVNQTMSPWNIFLLYQKIGDNDAGIATTDGDWDLYGLGITYTWKTGKLYGDLYYSRDRWTWPHGRADDNGYTFTGSGYQKFGAFTVGFRGKYGWGTASGGFPGAVDVETSGWNAMLAAEYKKGPYHIGVQGVIFDGQTLTGTKDETVGNIGQDYNGLYAAFGEQDGLLYPGNEFNNGTTVVGQTVNNYGLQVFLGYAEYKMLENLWVRAALGFIRWDDVSTGPAGTSTNFGTEFDLGAKYSIMKGFDLGVHFGYFIPGDWFVAPNKGNHLHLDWELTMKF